MFETKSGRPISYYGREYKQADIQREKEKDCAIQFNRSAICCFIRCLVQGHGLSKLSKRL